MISDADKQKLKQLKRELRTSLKESASRKELKKIADKYRNKVKAAVKDKDFECAEAYILEILEITFQKSQASEELTKLLGKIRAKK